MWPFNRKKNSEDSLKDKVSPKAVKEYYEAGGNRQGWVVWLLSIAAFLVTLLIVLGLFWAGRWTWHKLTDSSSKNEPATTQLKSGDQEQSPAKNETPSDDSGDNTGSNSGNPTAPTSTPSPAPAPAGPALPNTGPASDE
ncbi:MAG: hypothetical protein ABIQ89_01415 [Candidatus Saccharimonadales bacterium]